MGFGCANVQMWGCMPTFEHFCPVPVCPELRKSALLQYMCGVKFNWGRPLTWEYSPPPSLRGKGTFLIPLSIVCPLPSGFPQNRSPLKGNPPFWGKPSALAHDCFRGRHLYGAAMLCRLQCARCAKRVAHCRRTIRLALGTHTVAACCGSAPNKCASCTGLNAPRLASVSENSPTVQVWLSGA